MIIDKLIQKIEGTNNPSVVGIDTDLSYLPQKMQSNIKSINDACEAIFDFNVAIIEAVADIVPAVKVQAAFYEKYGTEGVKTFYKTLNYAKNKGLIVMADAKRNDIASTASAYAQAYLGQTKIGENSYEPFFCDFLTVGGYFGIDGIAPFVQECQSHDKGIFVLVKTSNPSSSQLQDLELADGTQLYQKMGDLVGEWGKPLIGQYGYSSVGAVVGATHPKQASVLRNKLKSVFFLVPGYGAQGATAQDLLPCFDERGGGAIVNSSRGILCACKQPKYEGQEFDVAARNAALDMKLALNIALGKNK